MHPPFVYDYVASIASGTAQDLKALANTNLQVPIPCAMILPLEDGTLDITLAISAGGSAVAASIPVLAGIYVPIRAVGISSSTTCDVVVFWSRSA